MINARDERTTLVDAALYNQLLLEEFGREVRLRAEGHVPPHIDLTTRSGGHLIVRMGPVSEVGMRAPTLNYNGKGMEIPVFKSPAKLELRRNFLGDMEEILGRIGEVGKRVELRAKKALFERQRAGENLAGREV